MGWLDSPKAQRRALIISGAVLIVGVIVFVSVYALRGTGNAFTAPISTNPAQLAKKQVKVPPSAEALKVARQFIETAVLRQNLDASYDIVHPEIKGTLTRKQWDTGNIPVVDYPADNAQTVHFVVDFSYQDEILLEADLVAKPHSQVRPHLDFYLGLKRAGDKPDGRWLVNYWEPNWRPPVPLAGAG